MCIARVMRLGAEREGRSNRFQHRDVCTPGQLASARQRRLPMSLTSSCRPICCSGKDHGFTFHPIDGDANKVIASMKSGMRSVMSRRVCTRHACTCRTRAYTLPGAAHRWYADALRPRICFHPSPEAARMMCACGKFCNLPPVICVRRHQDGCARLVQRAALQRKTHVQRKVYCQPFGRWLLERPPTESHRLVITITAGGRCYASLSFGGCALIRGGGHGWKKR